MPKKHYYKDGFTLANSLKNGLLWKKAAAVAIVKGQALFDDGSGYATNATTAFDSTFIGIAAASVDNSAGAAGALDVPVIPYNPNDQYWVKVEANALATQTIVGTIIDLEQNDSVDLSDTTVKGYGFYVDEIDVSADAVAVNTYGFVKGRILIEGDQT